MPLSQAAGSTAVASDPELDNKVKKGKIIYLQNLDNLFKRLKSAEISHKDNKYACFKIYNGDKILTFARNKYTSGFCVPNHSAFCF